MCGEVLRVQGSGAGLVGFYCDRACEVFDGGANWECATCGEVVVPKGAPNAKVLEGLIRRVNSHLASCTVQIA